MADETTQSSIDVLGEAHAIAQDHILDAILEWMVLMSMDDAEADEFLAELHLGLERPEHDPQAAKYRIAALLVQLTARRVDARRKAFVARALAEPDQ